jgi:O-acetyl-ADP-ribose deacetylase (regulator of RNase III)
MIRFKKGDILQEKAEALVNPVNCLGVMGAGLAHKFRAAFPGNYLAYKKECSLGNLKIGKTYIYDLLEEGDIELPRYIINLPTKRHWKDKSHLADIESGLWALVEEINWHGIASIAIPALGCGLGGLNWMQVRPLIEDIMFDSIADDIIVFEP